MTLAEYLQDHTATELADKCNVAVSTITRIARGEIAPRLRLIREIVAQTDGKVTACSFILPAGEGLADAPAN